MELPATSEINLSASQFILQARQLQEILRSVGVEMIPFQDPKLPYFSKLSSAFQNCLIESLKQQNEILREIIPSGLSPIACSKTLTMEFLRRNGLTAPDDLALHLTDFDHVVIYGLHQQMILLNPVHFRWMSYSLEDVLCRPWFELFRRNDTITAILRHRVHALVSSTERKSIENLDVPPHFITETNSPGLREITCRSKLYSPLYRDDKLVGFLSVNTGTRTHTARQH